VQQFELLSPNYAEGVCKFQPKAFAITPKAFANFSADYAEGVRQLQPRLTPKAFANFSPVVGALATTLG